MSSYKSQSLFDSGPHRFHVHGLAQRHVDHELPGADGVRVTVMGRTGRSIDQTGTLLADGIAPMQVQLRAIEAAMNDEPGDLVDDTDRTWANVLMLSCEPGPIRRVGVRLAIDYTIHYMQVQP
ncbi:MAG: hypothetical protein GC162_16855 [Planctomycetes bacterium]|nr:hypothetical protein [Planctomycetota bacterium]